MDKNKPTLAGKVKRYANVSSKITSATARMASNKIIGNNDCIKRLCSEGLGKNAMAAPIKNSHILNGRI